MKVDICLPVYNEQAILWDNVLRLWQFCSAQLVNTDWRLVILVNGSVDSSWQLAQGLASRYQRVVCYNFPLAGKGLAIKNYAKCSEADIIVYMDIDLAVKLEALPRLLDYSQDYQLALGSRLLPQSLVRRSLSRSLTSRVYNCLARRLLHLDTSDLQCGFKAVHRSDLIALLPSIVDDHWFFDTELVVWACKAGLSVKEMPVDWSENRYLQRQSKIKLWHDAWRFWQQLWLLKKKLK